eukprot:4157271-Amphidinium_carterae.1
MAADSMRPIMKEMTKLAPHSGHCTHLPSIRVYRGKHTPQAIPVLPFAHVSPTKQAPFNVHGNHSASLDAFSHVVSGVQLSSEQLASGLARNHQPGRLVSMLVP